METITAFDKGYLDTFSTLTLATMLADLRDVQESQQREPSYLAVIIGEILRERQMGQSARDCR